MFCSMTEFTIDVVVAAVASMVLRFPSFNRYDVLEVFLLSLIVHVNIYNSNTPKLQPITDSSLRCKPINMSTKNKIVPLNN